MKKSFLHKIAALIFVLILALVPALSSFAVDTSQFLSDYNTVEQIQARKAERAARQANMNEFEKFCDDFKNGMDDIFGTRESPRTANQQKLGGNLVGNTLNNISGTAIAESEKGLQRYAANAAKKATTRAEQDAFKSVEKTAAKGGVGKALTVLDIKERALHGHENNHNHEFMKKFSTAGNYFVIGTEATGTDKIATPASFIIDTIASDECASKMNGKTNNLLDVLDFFTIQIDGFITQLFGGNKYNWRKDLGFGDTDNLYAPRTAIKPNIYLYPEKETTVTVEFKDPDLLLTVIPDYLENWTVDATPDGWLDLEGETYGFLFYESMTSCKFMQTEEAWIVPEYNREGFFTEICNGYGFNARETEDFVTFWCSRLPEGKSYVMYPELTEVIDLEMPINISPLPDSIFRIWFLYVPVSAFSEDELSKIKTPNFTEKVTRKGFTVTEWGGIVDE